VIPQLADASVMPKPVDRNTGWSNVVRFRTSHGIMTTSAQRQVTTNSFTFFASVSPLSFQTIGMTASGRKSTTSARVSAPSPQAMPSRIARRQVGTFQNRYAASTITATMKMVIVSDVTIASWTQRFA
jgi:hypothetical protein